MCVSASLPVNMGCFSTLQGDPRPANQAHQIPTQEEHQALAVERASDSTERHRTEAPGTSATVNRRPGLLPGLLARLDDRVHFHEFGLSDMLSISQLQVGNADFLLRLRPYDSIPHTAVFYQ